MPTTAQLAALATWLRTHHDVVDTRMLRELAFHHDFAADQVRARRWQKVHRGVYAAHTGPLTFETRCAAALAACGPNAALDSTTALRLHSGRHDERLSRDNLIRVVVPHPVAAPSLDGVRVTRSRSITERSVLVRRDLRVVTVERAAVSAARESPARASALLTSLVQVGLTTAVRLRATVFAMGKISHRRALLAITYRVEGGDRSALERAFRELVRRAGLPLPVQNHPLLIDGRRMWLDACYPQLQIAIEVDGRTYHLLAEDWERDLARQNLIVLEGWLVLRFSRDAIEREPALVAAQLRAAITQQSRDRVA